MPIMLPFLAFCTRERRALLCQSLRPYMLQTYNGVWIGETCQRIESLSEENTPYSKAAETRPTKNVLRYRVY